MKGPSVHCKNTFWSCSIFTQGSQHLQSEKQLFIFIFLSPSWRVTCCHQNWPLTCQQRLSDAFAEASPHDPNKTNSLWVYNLNNWISGVRPVYIVGRDPVLSAHSVCACFLIAKTCRGTPSQEKRLHHHAAVSNLSHREQKHCKDHAGSTVFVT